MIDKCPHKLFLFFLGKSWIQLIEGQQQLINLIAGQLFLTDGIQLLIDVLLLRPDIGNDAVLLTIPALQIGDLIFIIWIKNVQLVHLLFKAGLCSFRLLALGVQRLLLFLQVAGVDGCADLFP